MLQPVKAEVLPQHLSEVHMLKTSIKECSVKSLFHLTVILVLNFLALFFTQVTAVGVVEGDFREGHPHNACFRDYFTVLSSAGEGSHCPHHPITGLQQLFCTCIFCDILGSVFV